MSNPMALSKNDIAKWIFIFVTGALVTYTSSITKHESVTLGSILYGAWGAFVLTYLVGIVIYGIRRVFGQPKVTRSMLGHGLYYGFYFIMIVFVLEVVLLVEAVIMS